MSITPRSVKFSSADESVAQAIVCEFADTWNRHDMPGTHEVETEDVEWINITGHHWCWKAVVYKGRDTIPPDRVPRIEDRGSFNPD